MPDQDANAPRRRGRPRKEAVAGERKSISFRVTEDVYKWLVSLSEMSGYSISEVVERHLEQQKSNLARQSLDRIFIGQSQSVDMLRNYSLIFAVYDKKGDWSKDEAARAGIVSAMEALNSSALPVDRSRVGIFARADQFPDPVRQAWEAGAQFGTILAGPGKPSPEQTD